MKNFIYLICTSILLFLLNNTYFEYVISREVPIWVIILSTFITVFLDGLGIRIIFKQVQKLLNL